VPRARKTRQRPVEPRPARHARATSAGAAPVLLSRMSRTATGRSDCPRVVARDAEPVAVPPINDSCALDMSRANDGLSRPGLYGVRPAASSRAQRRSVSASGD
jgi:hypothetical protein